MVFDGDAGITHIKRISNLTFNMIGTGVSGAVDGTGTSASFGSPWQCASSISAGTIVVSDLGNNLVRSIVTSSQVVSSLGSIPSPRAIWVDTSQMVYTASMSTHLIYRRLLSSGSFTAVAGGGGYSDGNGFSALFNTIYGLGGNDNFLYIADFANYKLRKMDTTTLDVTTIAGAGSTGELSLSLINFYFNSYFFYLGDGGDALTASISSPTNTGVDSNGDIYILELYSYKVR